MKLTLFRGVLLLTATMSFFTAIRYIPLADAVAIGFVAPLFVVALSIPMLGETVGPRRWAAVLIGLIGVVVIVRPGFADVHWAYGLMIFMAFIFAVFVIVTRMLTRTEETLSILFLRRPDGHGGHVAAAAVLLADPDLGAARLDGGDGGDRRGVAMADDQCL